MTLNVKVITFIPLVCINIRTTLKKIVPKIHTIFMTHFMKQFMEHISQNTFCGTHFMEHILWNTFCGTHFAEHTLQNTLHRTYFAEHISQKTFCGTHFAGHTLWNILRYKFCGTFWGTSFAAQVLRYVSWNISRYKLQDRIFLPVQHLVTKWH